MPQVEKYRPYFNLLDVDIQFLQHHLWKMNMSGLFAKNQVTAVSHCL